MKKSEKILIEKRFLMRVIDDGYDTLRILADVRKNDQWKTSSILRYKLDTLARICGFKNTVDVCDQLQYEEDAMRDRELW